MKTCRSSVSSPHLRWAVAFWLMGFAGVCGASASVRWATLEAIHRVENPRNVTRPGPYGELGPYQFRPTTWRMHTTVPFTRALDRRTADQVAVRHYDWIERGLMRANLPVTPFNIALAWNAGLHAVVNGRAPEVAHNYAERVTNLFGIIAANAGIGHGLVASAR